MNELTNTLFEILSAETATGKPLEGVTLARNEHETLTATSVVIKRLDEKTLAQAGLFKTVTGRAHISVVQQVSKRADSSDVWHAAEIAAEGTARVVERIILNNPYLKTTTYPEGFTRHGEHTHCEQKDYGYEPHGTSYWLGVAMVFVFKYIYRDGVIALR